MTAKTRAGVNDPAVRDEVDDDRSPSLESELVGQLNAVVEGALIHLGEPVRSAFHATRASASLFERVVRGLGAASDGSREFSVSEHVAIAAAGAAAARLGIDRAILPVVPRSAVKLATDVLLLAHATAQEEGQHGRSSLVRRYSDRITHLVTLAEEAGSALVAGFDTEIESRMPREQQEGVAFVERLLEKQLDDDRFAVNAAAAGAPGRTWALLVFVLGPGESSWDRRSTIASQLEKAVPQSAHGVVGGIRLTPVPHTCVLVGISDESILATAVDTFDRTSVVLIGPSNNPDTLASQYDLILPHLELTRAAGRMGHAIDVAELLQTALLASVPRYCRQQFVDSVLGPVLRLRREQCTQLLEAYDAVYAAGGSREAAGRLTHVDERTVERRLRKLFTTTGTNPRDPRGRLQLDLAFALRRLGILDGPSFDEDAWGPVSITLEGRT